MNLETVLKKRKTVLLLLFAILLAVYGVPFMGSVGYITGYQGLTPEITAVFFKWRFEGRQYEHMYTANDPFMGPWGKASALQFFDHLNFDPDTADSGKPNLKMSMQPITVDTLIPVKTIGNWQVKIESGVEEAGKIYDVYKQFQIDEYRCTWSVNLWCDGPENEAHQDEDHWYYDAEIWVKLDPVAFAYYEGNPDQLYFAPAYIGLSENAVWRSGKTEPNSGAIDYEMAGIQDIFPEAKGEVMGIFYELRGTEVNVKDEILKYEGIRLDPNLFRDEYWIRFGVDRFGAKSWYDWVVYHKWRYPSANLQFQINVFVVGEWTVKLETGEVPELDPRIPYWWEKDWLTGISKVLGLFISSPFTYLWILIVIVILYFVSKIIFGGKGAV